MNLLVIGGSGYVGSLVLPLLSKTHFVRIFDLKPPSLPILEYRLGDVCDPAALRTAMEGIDALLYMAMGSGQDWGSPHIAAVHFDANVKGVYLALRAAAEAGVRHAVYASSMSIYADLAGRYFPDEEITPDGRDFYGLTKRLGEEVCRNACREWGITVNALRLCLPRAEDRWLRETVAGTPTIATTEEDVARAMLAALDRRFGGFEAFMISGDYEHKLMNMAKAKRLLDWSPQARPRIAQAP